MSMSMFHENGHACIGTDLAVEKEMYMDTDADMDMDLSAQDTFSKIRI